MADQKVSVEITANTKKAEKNLKKVQRELDEVGKSAEQVGVASDKASTTMTQDATKISRLSNKIKQAYSGVKNSISKELNLDSVYKKNKQGLNSYVKETEKAKKTLAKNLNSSSTNQDKQNSGINGALVSGAALITAGSLNKGLEKFDGISLKMKEMSETLKSLAQGFKDIAVSLTTIKVDNLKEMKLTIESAQMALEELEDDYKQFYKEIENNTEAVNAFEEVLNNLSSKGLNRFTNIDDTIESGSVSAMVNSLRTQIAELNTEINRLEQEGKAGAKALNRIGTQANQIGRSAEVGANALRREANSINDFGNSSKKAEKGFFSLSTALLKIGIVVGTLKTAGNAIKSFLDEGSALQEVENVTSVVFSKMRNTVDRFTKTASKTAGLSETMARTYVGRFGAMAQSLGFSQKEALKMSETLTQLSGDVASFYNITQDEAYTKLKSVFSGETETLKDLGIVMTQDALNAYALSHGINKTVQQMTQAEKTSLRYRFVLDNLKTAQGDFTRTSGGWANQTRYLSLQIQELKANIGVGLIAALSGAIKYINVLMKAVVKASKAFSNLMTSIFGKPNASAGFSVSADDVGYGTEADAGTDNGLLGEIADNTAESAKTEKILAKNLAGFDEINNIGRDRIEKTPGSGGTGSSGGTGEAAPLTNIGNLEKATQEVGKFGGVIDGLKKKWNELKASFNKGFKIGLGDDTVGKITRIKKSFDLLKRSVNDIFNGINFDGFLNKLAFSLGQFTGAVTAIGLTLGEIFVGGIADGIADSKKAITKNINYALEGVNTAVQSYADLWTAFARIGEGITKPLTAIFGDVVSVFMTGATSILAVFSLIKGGIVKNLVRPITENTGPITKFFKGILSFIEPISDGLKTVLNGAFVTIVKVVKKDVLPTLDSFGKLVSEVFGEALKSINSVLGPIMKVLGKSLKQVFEKLSPAINGFIELLGSCVKGLGSLFKVLKPVLKVVAKIAGFAIGVQLAVMYTAITAIVGAAGLLITALLKLKTKVLKPIIKFLTKIADKGAVLLDGVFDVKTWKKIGKKFTDWWKGLTKWFGKKKNKIKLSANNTLTKDNLEKLGKTISETWDKVKEGASLVVDVVAEQADNLADTIWDGLNEAWGTISEGGLKVKAIISSKAGDLSSSWENIVKSWGEKAVNIGVNLKDGAADLWNSLKTDWGNAKNLAIGLVQRTSEGLGAFWEKIKDGWGTTKDLAIGLVQRSSEGLGAFWEKIKDGWGDAKTLAIGLAQHSGSKISDLWKTAKDWWNKTTRSLYIKMTSGSKKVWEIVKDWWDKAKKWWGSKKKLKINFNAEGAYKTVKKWWGNIKSWWKNNFGVKSLRVKFNAEGAYKTVKKWWSNIKDWWSSICSGLYVKIFGKNATGGVISRKARGGIVKMATGGVASRPTLLNNHLVGENGSEAVMPLERNTTWMNTLGKTIASEINRYNKTHENDRPLDITLNVGGARFGRACINSINQAQRQAGTLALNI